MEKRFKGCIDVFRQEGSTESLMEVLKTVADMCVNETQIVTPVDVEGVEEGQEIQPENVSLMHLEDGNGECYLVVFTSIEEHNAGTETAALYMPINSVIEAAKGEDFIAGVVINPWTDSFMLKNELIDVVTEMNEQKKVRSTSLEDDFYLHVIEEKPIDLYSAIQAMMPNFEAVNKVYVTGLNNKGKECYLLIVDFEGEEVGSLFSRILELIPALRDGKRVEMTPYTGTVPDGLTDLVYVK